MKEGRARKETLCWDCRNCTRCSWADGIPVKGWTATPTSVADCDGDYASFFVTQCPQFKADTKKQVTTEDMARILGKTKGEIIYTLRCKSGVIYLRSWFGEKGYRLRVFEIPRDNRKVAREFIIERLPRQK